MKAVIFDMDGVLINTEPLHYRCWKEILKEKNGIDLDYEQKELSDMAVFFQAQCGDLQRFRQESFHALL